MPCPLAMICGFSLASVASVKQVIASSYFNAVIASNPCFVFSELFLRIFVSKGKVHLYFVFLKIRLTFSYVCYILKNGSNRCDRF